MAMKRKIFDINTHTLEFPRKTTLKDPLIKRYNIYSLCCGELFDVVYSSDDVYDCLRCIKYLRSKYYDDLVIEVLFEEQQ